MASRPPPMGPWPCCQPRPVAWLTKAPWRNGLVEPVCCGASDGAAWPTPVVVAAVGTCAAGGDAVAGPA